MSKLLVNTLSLGTIGGTALYFWGKSSIPTTPVQSPNLPAPITNPSGGVFDPSAINPQGFFKFGFLVPSMIWLIELSLLVAMIDLQETLIGSLNI